VTGIAYKGGPRLKPDSGTVDTKGVAIGCGISNSNEDERAANVDASSHTSKSLGDSYYNDMAAVPGDAGGFTVPKVATMNFAQLHGHVVQKTDFYERFECNLRSRPLAS